MNLSESNEMYLETIYLLEKEDGHAHTVDIARILEVTNPSVSRAMNNLKEEGLVDKEVYGEIRLTEKGRIEAKKIYDKHQSLTKYLHHSLGLPMQKAEANACKMEHIVDNDLMEKVKKYLKENKLKYS